jgi:hypothetical protein
MASGTAMRAARLFLRRHADRCPVSMQSTSMCVVKLPGNHGRPNPLQKLVKTMDWTDVRFVRLDRVKRGQYLAKLLRCR